jgi:hypothetical protein
MFLLIEKQVFFCDMQNVADSAEVHWVQEARVGSECQR